MENKSKLSKENFKKETKAQTQSPYDSHSEEKPHQKGIVNTNSNPDRVSHDNTEDYIEKLPLLIEKATNLSDDVSKEDKKEKNPKREWDASFYPKKSDSSPSLK